MYCDAHWASEPMSDELYGSDSGQVRSITEGKLTLVSFMVVRIAFRIELA